VQINAGNDLCFLDQPLTDISEARRAEDGIWQDDSHAAAGFEELQTSFNE